MNFQCELLLGKQLMGHQGWQVRPISGRSSSSALRFRSIFPHVKTNYLVAVLSAFGFLGLHAQTSAPAQTGVPAPTAYQVVDRGANYKVWQRTVYEQGPKGQILARNHSYTELTSGMSYLQAGRYFLK
jgi:hypothetical protein